MLHDRDAMLARVDLEALADELLAPRARPGLRLWSCPNRDHAQTGKTPPLNIFNARTGHQRWHCHGCGDGGTAIDLLVRAGRVRDVREALDWLADRTGIAAVIPLHGDERAPARPCRPVPPPPPVIDRAVVEQLEDYTAACVAYLHSPGGRPMRAWLSERRAIPPDVIDAAGLGADPGPRVIPRPDGVPRAFPAVVFPVREDGRVVYTVSRHLRPVASRWWNTAERLAPNPRLAFYRAPGSQPSTGLVVTEGPIDALSAVAAGYDAAAILGAGTVGPDVADRLANAGQRLLLALDNDEDGRRGQGRLAELLTQRSTRWLTVPIPLHHGDLNAWHLACRVRWPSVMSACDRLVSHSPDIETPPPTVA
jgi:hypothetical protein